MNQPMIKALICDDSAASGVRIASELSNRQIYAYTRHGSESSIISSILSDKPDVVILELTLENTDAAAIIQKVTPLLTKIPAFIVISDIDNNFIRNQIIGIGAAYYLVKPFTAEKLADIVNSVAAVTPEISCQNANLLTTELIRKAGIPAHVKGYSYIRACIIECLNDKTLLDSITKRLYSIISEKYKATPVRVERAIRHAISIAWDRNGSTNMSACLGYITSPLKSRPSNAEFIAMATDKIHLQILTSDSREIVRNSDTASYYQNSSNTLINM